LSWALSDAFGWALDWSDITGFLAIDG
jgi:hypothetical protein